MTRWLASAPLGDADYARLRTAAIFDCCKWDPQVGDIATIARVPLVLSAPAWAELAALAEALASEALAAETELLTRPELIAELGLPAAVVRRLPSVPDPGPRVMRFDFHLADDGWRISEGNVDVPGGFNEAAGVSALMAAHYPRTRMAGDPAAALVAAIASAITRPGIVALVHATAYSDDRQVMAFLARRFAAAGLPAIPLAPDHLVWNGDGCRSVVAQGNQPVAAIVRFFPAEWLPALGRSGQWRRLVAAPGVPACNPASALLVQSKRFPLTWNRLSTRLPTWSRLLPATRCPSWIGWRDDPGWILKPALGRVGQGIAMRGVTPTPAWAASAKAATRRPREWVAQRRFDAVPWQRRDGDRFPCIGVYTVAGRVAGAYGRACARPLVDHTAEDVAVLVAAVED